MLSKASGMRLATLVPYGDSEQILPRNELVDGDIT